MTARLVRLTLPLILFVLVTFATAKDKKKPVLPEDILRAQTVRVVIDRDAGEPLDQPRANYMARDNVEKALMEWGRFRDSSYHEGWPNGSASGCRTINRQQHSHWRTARAAADGRPKHFPAESGTRY